MKRIFTILFLIIISTGSIFSQAAESSPLQGKLLLTVSGGATIPQTDFKEVKLAPIGIANLEYFFSIKSKHALGLRLQGGIGTLKGNDERHTPFEFSDNLVFAGGGIVYSYAVDEVFLPYIFLGAANVWYNPQDSQGDPIINDKPASESLSRINYNGEIGLKINLSRRFGLNFSAGEFLCQGDQLDGIAVGKHDDVFLYVTAGLSVSFLGETDSDGDGVWDADDACPNTPSGVQVDLMGCPIDTDRDGVPDNVDKCTGTPPGIEVDESGCPLDTDKDGVPDYLDNCPNSPRGVPVDNLGCIKDSDKDDVPDYIDNCPDTPAGIRVDAKGCPEDVNKNGVPDYLEENEPAPELKPEKQEYNLQNEHIVRDMIFTDGRLYTAQISAWRTKVKAETEAAKLNQQGYNAFVAQIYFEEWNETWYRVRVGYFKSFEEAQSLAYKLR